MASTAFSAAWRTDFSSAPCFGIDLDGEGDVAFALDDRPEIIPARTRSPAPSGAGHLARRRIQHFRFRDFAILESPLAADNMPARRAGAAPRPGASDGRVQEGLPTLRECAPCHIRRRPRSCKAAPRSSAMVARGAWRGLRLRGSKFKLSGNRPELQCLGIIRAAHGAAVAAAAAKRQFHGGAAAASAASCPISRNCSARARTASGACCRAACWLRARPGPVLLAPSRPHLVRFRHVSRAA